MKNATQNVKKLNSLIKKLAKPAPTVFPDGDDSIVVLVQSFLMWEATTEKALIAYQRIIDDVVDFNDLRACMPFEVADMIGARYPKALERCERLRATLRDIYRGEHAVCFEALRDKGKRDIKKYIDSLDGITPYVASRVQLTAFDVHSIPVDEQLRLRLVAAEVVDAKQSVGDLTNWLARQIKAEEGQAVHAAFQAWMDTPQGKTTRGAKRSTSSKKKTTKKNPSSKKSTAKAANS